MPNLPDRVPRPWIRKAERRPWQEEPKQFGSDPFYQSMAWRNIRNSYIKRHPLCAECHRMGRTRAGAVVDHIKPRSEGGDSFAEANLQTLCEKCHNRKRGTERKNRNNGAQ